MAAGRVTRARQEGAPLYAADLFMEAEQALERAQEALSASNRFREATEAASLACIRADEARARAEREKATIYREANRLLRECEALMEEARSGPGEKPQYDLLESLSSGHRSLVIELEAGRVSEAREEAKQLKETLLGVLRDLERQP